MKRGRRGKTLDCEICETQFYAAPSRLIKNKHHTCSRKCTGILQKRIQSRKISVPCFICEKVIEYKKSHLKDIAYPTCSYICAAKIRSVTYSKTNNPRSLKLNDYDRYFWERAKECNRRNKIKGFVDVKVSHVELIDIYEEQKGLCLYTKLPMVFHSEKGKADFNVLSIDRINPSLGYFRANIAFVLNCMNMMKSNHTMVEVKLVLNAIRNNPEYT